MTEVHLKCPKCGHLFKTTQELIDNYLNGSDFDPEHLYECENCKETTLFLELLDNRIDIKPTKPTVNSNIGLETIITKKVDSTKKMVENKKNTKINLSNIRDIGIIVFIVCWCGLYIYNRINDIIPINIPISTVIESTIDNIYVKEGVETEIIFCKKHNQYAVRKFNENIIDEFCFCFDKKYLEYFKIISAKHNDFKNIELKYRFCLWNKIIYKNTKYLSKVAESKFINFLKWNEQNKDFTFYVAYCYDYDKYNEYEKFIKRTDLTKLNTVWESFHSIPGQSQVKPIKPSEMKDSNYIGPKKFLSRTDIIYLEFKAIKNNTYLKLPDYFKGDVADILPIDNMPYYIWTLHTDYF